jgi:hypothetical protein
MFQSSKLCCHSAGEIERLASCKKPKKKSWWIDILKDIVGLLLLVGSSSQTKVTIHTLWLWWRP